MRKHLSVLMLLAALIVPWASRAQSCTISQLPYFNDFENEPHYVSGTTPYAQAFPACWTRINDATGTYNYYPYINTSTTYLIHGSKSMYWYHSTSTTYANNEYAVLPPVDLSVYDISDLTLSFWARTTATASPWPLFIVGVMTSPTDASTFTPLDTITLTNTATLYAVSLANYTDTGRYIAIRYPRPTSARYCSLDDVYLTDNWCDLPGAVTASATTDAVTLTWNANGGTSFTVFVGNDTIANVNDTTYTFTNLSDDTEYAYGVARECATGISMFITGSIHTLCLPISSSDLPYTEDFESYGTGSASPISPCWAKGLVALVGSGTTTNFPYPYSTAAINGSRGLYFYAATTSSTSYYNWLVLPPIDDTELSMSDLMVSFDLKRTATSTHKTTLVVGVTTDYHSTAGFVPVDTIELSTAATGSIHNIEVSFANYTGTGRYVLFYAPAPTMTGSTAVYNAFYVDDITLRAIPTCYWPTSVTLESVSSDAATLKWVPDARTPNPSSWSVEYGPHGFTRGTGITETAYDTTITITGLTPSTEYDVYVRANCSGDFSDPTMYSFHTQCVALDSLPFTENFDGITGSTATTGMANILPPCWDYYNDGTRTNYQGCPYVYSNTTYSHSGTNCIRFYTYTASGDSNQYLILPITDSTLYPISDLQLGFWLRAYNTTSTYHADVVVGVMTNPSVESSFIPCTTVTSTSTTYAYYEYSFGQYAGNHGCIALKFPKPATSGNYEYGYVDDVTLGLAPACTPVANLRVDSLSVDWANISWTDNNGSSWVIEYDTVNFVPGAGTAAFTTTVTDSSYFMPTLDTGRTYYVYVRSNCGSDTSTFVGLTVTTLASLPALVPYTCDFEGPLTDGWEFIQAGQDNYWMVGTATHNGGSKSMYITDNDTANSYSVAASYSFATRTFNLTEVGEYAYSYDWKCNGESTYDFIRAALVPAGTVLTAGAYSGFDNASAMPAGGIALDGGGRLNLQTSWQTQSGSFYITTPGTYTWVFMWRNDGSVFNTPPAAIDNINVVRNTCPAPINLTATHVTADSIVVSWHPVGNETSWLVSNGIDDAVAIDTTYTFDNLNSSTAYTITVRALCSVGDTSMDAGITVYTACLYATLPLIENFDDVDGSTATAPTASFLPPCWDYYNHGTRTNYMYCPYVYNSTTYAHSGANCIRFYSYNSSADSNQYLILPVIDSTEYLISDLQLSFWLRGNSTSSNYFANVVVGVMTDANVESSFIPYDTINYASTTYAYQEINFDQYTGPHGRVTMLFPKPSSSSQYEYGYVDDVMLGPIPTCLGVENLTSTYASSDTIMLAWNSGGNEAQWEVTYDSSSVIVYDSFFVADNLASNTEYTFSVRAICGVGDTSYPITYSTRTDCGPITILPYMESFENLPVGASANLDCGVPCWGRLDNASQYHFGYVGSPSSWPTGGHTGTGFLYYYMPTTATTYADWILTILPSLDVTIHPINTLQVSFWVKMNSATTTGDIQVGVISNTNADSTFVPLDTVHVSGNVYDLKTAYLSGYTGNGTNIALKFFRNPSTATYYFLDDVTIEPMPDCPPVSNIVLGGLDSNYITVTWTENGAATSWNVEYGPTGFVLGTGTTDSVNTNSITINGLAAGTEYDVYITPECSGGVAATRMGTFRTANAYVQLPFICNFEDTAQNTLWTLENGTMTNKWYIGNGTNNGGSNALYISDNNGTSNNYNISSSGVVFAYTDVMISAPGDYAYSFDWKAYGESSIDYIRAVLVPASVTFTPGTALPAGLSATATPANWVAIDGGNKLNLQTSWQTRSDVISVTSAGVYHLLFMWRNDGSVGTQPPAAIDNVELAQMTCTRPINIALNNLTQTSVNISWDEAGSATAWQYQLDNNTPVIVTDTSCTFTTLSANTEYTFRVRSICGAGDTSFWLIYTFRTPCGYLTLPYVQDFELEATGSSTTGSVFANCWTRLNNGTSYGGYPYVSATSSYNHTTSGTKGLYWYNTTTMGTYGDYQCVVLPPVDPSVAIDSLQLSFWTRATSASYTPTFQIGVMTDPNNIATFVGVDTVMVTSGTSWSLIEVPLVTYTGTGAYVAIKSDRAASAWYANVDDVLLEYIPTCLIPQNVISTGASTTSITIDWTDLTPASEWQVRYGQSGGNTTIQTVNSHPVTITGLDTLTTYAFEVRAVCTVGDTSRWSQSAIFSTELCNNAYAATTGTATGTSYYTPVNNYYKNTLSETIIDSAELAGIGDIAAIAYSYAYATASTDKTDVTIWLQPTMKSVFSSTTDIELLDTTIAVQVYQGHLNCSQGWNYFQFDTTYTWDGHNNLLVIVDDNSNDYNGSAYTFNTSSCTGYKTLVWYSDSYNPDPTSTSFSGTKAYYQYRATMKLVSCGASPCVTPDIDSVMPAETAISFMVSIPNGSTPTIEAVATTEPWTDSLAATLTPVSGPSTSVITLTGLTENTPYTVAIRTVCGGGRYSDWITLPISTLRHPCAVPTNVQVTDNSYDGATISWTSGENEGDWEVRVFCESPYFDHTYPVSGIPSRTIHGLDDGVTYSVAVRAMCDSAWVSPWSDTLALITTTCPRVEGVTEGTLTYNSAVINWTSTGVDSYQIEYGNMGFQQGTGTMVTSTTTSVTLTGLEEETVYDVYVRSVCTEAVQSQWSERLRITTPQNNGIDDVESGSVTLYPNPASTTVTLRGIDGESTVTVVDLNGREVYRDHTGANGHSGQANANSLTIDVSGYAKGAYFVRVTGERTTVIRKLVVK